jgi:conjugative relaxase-like TrwC/TraI family protein
MLSPYAMTLGQEAYYTGLATEDYYLEGGEPPGRWLGKGAERLGLVGQVDPDDLSQVFRGYAPGTGDPLVQHQAGKTRQPGWDLTFSAPKTVSVMWASLPAGEARDAISKAHREAVNDALEFLEQTAVFSRRGKGGKAHESAEAVIAAFDHFTSRAADPQLHTHALTLNAGYRGSDGSWGTIESHHFYEAHRFAAGALYRMSLATRMETLGYETAPRIESKLHSFELAAVPGSVADHFSKRRKEMEEHIEEHGYQATAKNFAAAALFTRSRKGHVALDELFPKWHSEAKKLGFEPMGPEREPRVLIEAEQWAAASGATIAALSQLAQRGRPFTEPELVRLTAERLQAGGVQPSALLETIREEVPKHTTKYEQARGPIPVYMAPSVLTAQERVVGAAHEIRAGAPDELNFNADVLQLGLRPQQLQCVETFPGSDSRKYAKELARGWASQGLKVHAVTRTRFAAAQFKRKTGLETESIGFLVERLKPHSVTEMRGQSARQMARAAAERATWAYESVELGKNDILLIHDTHKIHPTPLGDLLEAAKQSGASVVAFGERKELGKGFSPSTRHSWGTFEKLCDASPTIVAPGKPLPTWRHIARAEFEFGQMRSGLAAFIQQGCASPHYDGDQARASLARRWVQKPDAILVGKDAAEVRRLNRAVQYERSLGGRSVRAGGEVFRKKERVIFNRSNRGYGFAAGEFGTIEKIQTEKRFASLTREVVTIRLEQKGKSWAGVPLTRRVTLPAAALKHTSLGYAFTPEAAREMDADDVYVHVTPGMEASELSGLNAPNVQLDVSYAALGEDLEAAQQLAREEQQREAQRRAQQARTKEAQEPQLDSGQESVQSEDQVPRQVPPQQSQPAPTMQMG